MKQRKLSAGRSGAGYPTMRDAAGAAVLIVGLAACGGPGEAALEPDAQWLDGAPPAIDAGPDAAPDAPIDAAFILDGVPPWPDAAPDAGVDAPSDDAATAHDAGSAPDDAGP